MEQMKNKRKKKAKAAVLVLALIGSLTIAGISAYFTDGDTATNTFTVGKISLDLQEPGWVEPEDITPAQDIVKDPQILNNGVNEEYVFLEVIMPYAANLVTANDDGTRNAAADTELFSYNVNPGWVEIQGVVNGITYPTKDTADQTVTHLYAYGDSTSMAALEAGDVTPALFNYVRFCNAVEDQKLEETAPDIVINAYGIQTLNINDGADINGSNTDGKVNPMDVWSVLHNQSPAVNDK